MLIVYQSLESVGNTDDSGATAIIGNTFKRRVHATLRKNREIMSMVRSEKGRAWQGNELKYIMRQRPEMASEDESIALYKHYRSLLQGDEAQKKDLRDALIQFLTEVVTSIDINTAACTKQDGSTMPFTRMADMIIFGEIYGSDLKGVQIGNYIVTTGMNPTGDARHRFMVLQYKPNTVGKRIWGNYERDIEIYDFTETSPSYKNENAKCMMIKVRGWLIAFVHIPNAICSKRDQAVNYIRGNVKRVAGGRDLDLLVGDTNQQSTEFVRNYMNGLYNTQGPPGATTEAPWNHSVTEKKQVVRGYSNYVVSGTNTGYDKQFDIACTNRAYVKIKGLTRHETTDDNIQWQLNPDEIPVFIFHGLTEKCITINGKLYAYSDHNGVIVEILRDETEHAYTHAKADRSGRKRDWREQRTAGRAHEPLSKKPKLG